MTEEEIEAEKRRLRIMMDPALAHLREDVPEPAPSPEPEIETTQEPRLGSDIWAMTRTEERSLIEYGTLADWAQDALRRSLLDEDTSATEGIYTAVGMERDELGVWDYPEDMPTPTAPQHPSERRIEAPEPEPQEKVDPYAGLTTDEIKDMLLKEHRAKTGRF